MKNKNTQIGFTHEIEINPNDRWIKLVEYGQHPHSVGLQCLDKSAAEEIVRYFKSIKGKLDRKFGGLPIYIGHPDDPAFKGTAGHTDTRAYGWIKDIEAREDAIYIHVKWSEKGEEILTSAYYKHFSPRWNLQAVSLGKFRPTELVSVGLTNTPNILGDVISNEKDSADIINKIKESLDLGADAQDDAVLEAFEVYVNSAQKWEKETEKLVSENKELHLEIIKTIKNIETLKDQLSVQEALVKKLEIDLSNEKEAHSSLLVDKAVEGGVIAPNDIELWKDKFAENFQIAANEIQNAEVIIPVKSKTQKLYVLEVSKKSPREDFISLVNKHMKETGEDYASAWAHMKQVRSDLYRELEG